MPTMKVNGTTLEYREYGSGDKYLFSTQNFFLDGNHMELLGKPPYNYHVYLITMRGYGQSEHIYEDFARDFTCIWGEDVLAFADAVGAESFYYSGVSHGCFAGWYIALHYPERLRGFAATSGVVQFARPATPPAVSPKDEAEADALVGNREALDKIAWQENDDIQDAARQVRRLQNHENHLALLLERKKEEYLVRNTTMSCCDAPTEAEFEARLRAIPVPLLILNGMRDKLSTPEKALAVAALVPRAKLTLYEQLGHGGPDECPGLVARECDRFFKDIEEWRDRGTDTWLL